MIACAQQVDTHVFNKAEGKLRFAFVADFCVNNANTTFVQKYEYGVRGPLSKQRSSLANVKVSKFAKRESIINPLTICTVTGHV